MPGLPPNGEGLKTLAQMVVGTFDNRKIDAEYLETPDGRIVENWVFTGKHTGEAMGIPPSGEAITIRGIEIWRIADGKIVERWGVDRRQRRDAESGSAPVVVGQTRSVESSSSTYTTTSS